MDNSFSSHPVSLPRWAQRGILVFAVLAILLGLGASSIAPSAHAASANRSAVALAANGTVEGCPLEAACIYPVNAGWNGGVPEGRGIFFALGVHQLSNEFKSHRVFNNQTHKDLVWLCRNANGTDCPVTFPTGGSLPLCAYPEFGVLVKNLDYGDIDLTPYNSIKLTAFQSRSDC